jgi:MYXO-CTERM domain-containing protein
LNRPELMLGSVSVSCEYQEGRPCGNGDTGDQSLPSAHKSGCSLAPTGTPSALLPLLLALALLLRRRRVAC